MKRIFRILSIITLLVFLVCMISFSAVMIVMAENQTTDTIQFFSDKSAFLSSTNAHQTPFPPEDIVGNEVSLDNLVVTAPNGTPTNWGDFSLWTIAYDALPLWLSPTNPYPSSGIILCNGEDDFLLTFTNAIPSIGIMLITNGFDNCVVTLADQSNSVFSDSDVKYSPNSEAFFGYSSKIPIKSIFIDTQGGNLQNSAIIEIWQGSNQPPTATDDTYSINEDSTLIVPASSGVLANDTDPEENPLTAIPVSIVSHGTMELSADGSFTYTPAEDYYGSDSFTYKSNDSVSDSNVATVTITVNPPATPNIASVNPEQASPGKTLDVVITGTNFASATALSFGDGIAINSFTVDSDTQITVSITIDSDATIDTSDVSVTTPDGTDTLTKGFKVEEEKSEKAGWWPYAIAIGATLVVLLIIIGLLIRRRKVPQNS